MNEPTYSSVGEFAEAYGFTRREMSLLIAQGEFTPRRNHGNSVLSETDFVRYLMRKHHRKVESETKKLKKS